MSAWWWCLRHGAVEDDAGCALADRLGPYASRVDAGRALETARRRTQEQDERERADGDWGTPPAGA